MFPVFERRPVMLSENEASAVIAKLPRDSDEQKLLAELLHNSIQNKSPPNLTSAKRHVDADSSVEGSTSEHVGGGSDDEASQQDQGGENMSDDSCGGGSDDVDDCDGDDVMHLDKFTLALADVGNAPSPEHELALQNVDVDVLPEIFDTIEKLKEEDETRNPDQIIKLLEEQHGVQFSTASLYKIKVYLHKRSNRNR
jgi:hypothetical protein